MRNAECRTEEAHGPLPFCIHRSSFRSELPGLDSNQDKESQNLLCYRYTTG